MLFRSEFMYNKEKRTQREIAKILNKHYNTIYNEIKRGTIKLLDRNLKEALAAKEDGADYLGVGAMFNTSTKDDAKMCIRDSL